MKNEVDMNMDMVLISIYNATEEENKIYVNDADFFENTFENKYDAAWAVSMSGRWRWTDDYVCFDNDGYLSSFTHWDDEGSPIKLDKLDISQLINSLKKWSKKEQEACCISRAVRDALE